MGKLRQAARACCAKRRGAHLILINLDPTPLDPAMDVVIRADVTKALSQLARAILS